MKTWTIDEMLAETPLEYHSRALLEALWDGRERLSILDVLRLPISTRERLCIATIFGALEPTTRSRWQAGIVTRAINRALEVYDAPEFAAWAQGWLNGADRSAESARAAYTAARAAAEAVAQIFANAPWTAWAAAYAAAYAAESSTYTAAAYAVAAAAGWAADAAVPAAEAAEREQQVADLVTILEDT